MLTLFLTLIHIEQINHRFEIFDSPLFNKQRAKAKINLGWEKQLKMVNMIYVITYMKVKIIKH